MELKDKLQYHFGYSEFKESQERIIQSVLDKQDTLALMPTGGGKSICYQLPALIQKGIGIVISPLIALMKDQVDALRQNGIQASYINSSQSHSEQDQILKSVAESKIKLLYLSPERLFGGNSYLIEFLKKRSISLIAIDEAHCISQWGHDFRPEYLKLKRLKSIFINVPTIALTATADQRTKEDIIKNLGLKDPAIYISSFNRPNISYHIKRKQKSKEKLLDFLQDYKNQTGIIYVLSRASAESIAEFLQDRGLKALPYHAGLSSATRDKHQELFINDEINIIVATIAFGMGIDKSNVRFVVHMDLPKNIEGYYQETGRAGRDGLDSTALLFYSRGDSMILRKFIEQESEVKQQETLFTKLNQMIAFAETKKCRRQFLLEYFDEAYKGPCNSCDICLADFEYFDGTIIAQKAISAVVRLQGRFGAGYVIDFLRGSSSKKIKEEHTWIKTFGVGKNHSKQEWQNYIQSLIDQSYLRVSEGRYPLLKLGPKSMDALHGNSKVSLIKQKKEKVRKKELSVPIEDALLDALKLMRKKLSIENGVPPYVIFSDATLVELAAYLPIFKSDLLKITGFGEVKLNKFGDQFLEIIQSYVNAKSLESRIDKKIHLKKTSKSSKPNQSSATAKASFQLFSEGKSISEIAAIRSLSPQTVETHLIPFVRSRKIKITSLVEDKKIDPIKAAIHKYGNQGLRIVKDNLNSDTSYADIKFVKAYIEN